MSKNTHSTAKPNFFGSQTESDLFAKPTKPSSTGEEIHLETAIVYCEGNFGEIDGKTANGLARHSEKYKIVSIIDSTKGGKDAGEVLDGKKSGIPIYRDLGTALAHAGRAPNHLIFGIAPASGMLSPAERRLLLRAISYGINIVNELHEFLNEDPEFKAACAKQIRSHYS
jgi:uncharacterized NAD-dependent epimerase/dehydratase family protein